MELKSFKERTIQEVEKLKDELIALSRALHANPETAYKEQKSSALIADFLRRHGFNIEMGVCGLETAFRGLKKCAMGEGPRVAFIVEYDALPGLGHGCGHNLIASAGAGAAIGLAAFSGQLPGEIIVAGTPAEEGGGGKIHMVNRGFFRDVDAAMMVHPSNRTVVAKNFLAMTSMEFHFYGRAAHAAAFPHKGVNALDAVLATFNSINSLRQQMRSDARVHGIITEGGKAPNIIPDKASAYFYVRSLEVSYLDELVEKVRRCAEGAALATGARLEVKMAELRYLPFKVNRALSELFSRNLKLLNIGETPSVEDEIGSSDIGNLSQVVPTIHPELAICHQDVAIHSEDFKDAAISALGEEMMLAGAKAMTMTALDLLLSKGNFEKVRKEFVAPSAQ